MGRSGKNYRMLLLWFALLTSKTLLGLMVELKSDQAYFDAIRLFAQHNCNQRPQEKWSDAFYDIICFSEQRFDVLDKTANRLLSFNLESGAVVEQYIASQSGVFISMDRYKLPEWGLAIAMIGNKGVMFFNAAKAMPVPGNLLNVKKNIHPFIPMVTAKLPKSAWPKSPIYGKDIAHRLFVFLTPEGELVVVRRSLEIGWLNNYSYGAFKVFDLEEVKANLMFINDIFLKTIKGKSHVEVVFSYTNGLAVSYKLNAVSFNEDGFTMEAIN
jgi:hypothetical protein